MMYEMISPKRCVRYAAMVLLLIGSLATISFAQPPSGRVEDPKSGGKRGSGRKPADKPDPGPASVYLTVLTEPSECSVYINGQSRGVTDSEGKLQIEKLPLGTYSFEVRKEGFTTAQRNYRAGYETTTLVFKLQPNLDDVIKQFDQLVSEGKLVGPDSPNASEVIDAIASKSPDNAELVRMRTVLTAKLMETVTPVIGRTVANWRTITRDEILKAIEVLKTAAAIKGDDKAVQARAAYLRGVLALRDWQAAGAQPGASSQGGEGGAEAGGLAGAKAELEKALQFEESLAAARYYLGQVLLASGDPAGAEVNFSRVTQVEPRWANAFFGVGSAFHNQGRYVEAIDAYRKAILVDSGYAPAYAGLGLARSMKGEKDAITDIQRAIELDSSSALPHLNLAIIFSKSRKDKRAVARAIEELKKAIQLNANNAEFPNRVAEQLLAELEKPPPRK